MASGSRAVSVVLPNARYRLELCLQRVFGQSNVGPGGVVDPALFERVKVVRLGGCGLDKLKDLDFSAYTGVQELTLPRNNLKRVVGLEHLTDLRILNLHANRSAIIDNSLKQLAAVTSLVKLRLADTQERALNPKYLKKVRDKLVPNNGQLRQIENEVISIDDRTQLLKVRGSRSLPSPLPTSRLRALHTHAVLLLCRRHRKCTSGARIRR